VREIIKATREKEIVPGRGKVQEYVQPRPEKHVTSPWQA